MSQLPTIARNDNSQVGLGLQIETPENVVLTYQLAGPAIRAAAYLIDLCIRVVLMIAILLMVVVVGFALPGSAIGLFLVILFLVEWGYFVICEGFFRGKTIGKHVLELRVIQENGSPITFWAAMIRNLLRVADIFPLYGPGFVSMICSNKFQRLGDRAAGTVVVAERRVVLPREPLILEKIELLSRDEIGTFIPPQQTLATIDEFLGRRHVLTHERGHELALGLADSLARKLDFRGDPGYVETYPMAFLARVYVTFLRRGEENGEPDQAKRRRQSRTIAAGGI